MKIHSSTHPHADEKSIAFPPLKTHAENHREKVSNIFPNNGRLQRPDTKLDKNTPNILYNDACVPGLICLEAAECHFKLKTVSSIYRLNIDASLMACNSLPCACVSSCLM